MRPKAPQILTLRSPNERPVCTIHKPQDPAFNLHFHLFKRDTELRNARHGQPPAKEQAAILKGHSENKSNVFEVKVTTLEIKVMMTELGDEVRKWNKVATADALSW